MSLHDIPKEKPLHPVLSDEIKKALIAFQIERGDIFDIRINKGVIEAKSTESQTYFPEYSAFNLLSAGWLLEYNRPESGRTYPTEPDWNKIEVIP